MTSWSSDCALAQAGVELGGWRLADRENRIGWTLPRLTLPAGERLLVFADSKDREAGLHTNFSLSAGETVYLYNSHGYLVHQLLCSSETGDVSVVSAADGEQTESLYPTPGYENSYEGYLRWQETLEPQGPLVISEVAVSNRSGLNLYLVGTSDWVEIRNISDETVDLSEYFLSDDKNNYLLWRFPAETLAPQKPVWPSRNSQCRKQTVHLAILFPPIRYAGPLQSAGASRALSRQYPPSAGQWQPAALRYPHPPDPEEGVPFAVHW